MTSRKPKNRNADNGESPTATTATTTTPLPTIPPHFVRQLWSSDSQSWPKQDDKTLWCNLYVPERPSCPLRNCH